MNVSRFVASLNEPHKSTLQLDLLPDLSEAEVTQSLDASQGGKKSVQSILHHFVPKNMAQCLLTRAQVAEGVTLAELPRKARMNLIDDLKRMAVPLSGTRGYGKAEVTMGGVKTQEVNPHTMESRLAPVCFSLARYSTSMAPSAVITFRLHLALAIWRRSTCNQRCGPVPSHSKDHASWLLTPETNRAVLR